MGFLGNIQGVGKIPRQMAAVLDENVLIQDDIIQLRLVVYNASLHDDGVPDHRALADLDAAEDDGVFHRDGNCPSYRRPFLLYS